METKKRGRPRKIKPEESKIEEPKIEQPKEVVWDVKKDDPIEFFDANLSFELTGYRPINDTKGLDFNPNWFTEARDTFIRTGHYTEFKKGSKAYADFWKEQYSRCKYGMTVNNYTITGDHYFFLNFYQLRDLSNVKEAGSGRQMIFPAFLEGQYEWFHYLLMAKRLKVNACMMKAREAGYSEIEAAILSKSYTVIKGSVNVACAYAANQLDKLLEKVWGNIAFLDNYTDSGFRKGRVVDTAYLKRSGQFKMINGVKTPTGWLSQIQGIVVDKPGKLRGDRTDVLMYEEAGLWPGLMKAYTMADALVGQIGRQFGLRILGGTGGESGPQLEGLRNMYYNPKVFGILPFRHNYTQTGDSTISSFFLPAFKTIKDPKLLDNRGYISEREGRKIFDKTREIKASIPQELITYCAEFCYTAEEAFALEGDNKFNKVVISEQIAKIRVLKQCPKIDSGFLEYTYKGNVHTEQNITGFRWIPNSDGKIKILEHPLWTLPERKNIKGEVEWKPPEKTQNLYVIGIDGIDIGKNQTSLETKSPSDFCLTVKKRVFGIEEPQYVAIYKDRPSDVREAYKTAIKIAQYYNASINIEATRLGLITYAREKKLLRLFMKRPRATLSDVVKGKSTSYGTPATKAIIAHQTDLIADFINDYGHNIWFEEMLEELNQYNDANKTSFDIVASMGMAELADEELQGTLPRKLFIADETEQQVGYYTDENGIKRWGVIPLTIRGKISYNNDFGQNQDHEYTRIRTSDPRKIY